MDAVARPVSSCFAAVTMGPPNHKNDKQTGGHGDAKRDELPVGFRHAEDLEFR